MFVENGVADMDPLCFTCNPRFFFKIVTWSFSIFIIILLEVLGDRKYVVTENFLWIVKFLGTDMKIYEQRAERTKYMQLHIYK